MERVTPQDLERSQLPKSLRGYQPEAVDRLLASVSTQMESQLVEIRRLQQSLRDCERELDRFRSQETLMKEALMLANRAAEETRTLAQREAETIVQAARQEAAEIKRSAKESVLALQLESERLSEQKRAFEFGFRALLREHLDRLGSTMAVVASHESEATAS
ncbi:MAG: DivIVA domain-containing protein [Fimbriimonadaceae bacterium]|nr:DivIVA domain-containing protein [Fimbriimonadaceae bacterium]QYK58614.1 MAG: DivIVA domain-containing protein [Fimbriimonadaceae bacterium]